MSSFRAGRTLVSGLTRSGVQIAFLDLTKAANDAVTRHGIASTVHAEALARAMSSAVRGLCFAMAQDSLRRMPNSRLASQRIVFMPCRCSGFLCGAVVGSRRCC
jgi:hypothetical protein